jgi:hypothetical protein
MIVPTINCSKLGVACLPAPLPLCPASRVVGHLPLSSLAVQFCRLLKPPGVTLYYTDYSFRASVDLFLSPGFADLVHGRGTQSAWTLNASSNLDYVNTVQRLHNRLMVILLRCQEKGLDKEMPKACVAFSITKDQRRLVVKQKLLAAKY